MKKPLPGLALHKLFVANSGGFALSEVLVSMLIITLYVALGFQSLVISTLFKVRAERDTKIANWIEADLAVLRYQGGTLQTILNIPITNDGIRDVRCGATTATAGFAEELRTRNIPTTNPEIRSIVNRNFAMLKTYSIDAARPQVLRVNYVVTDQTNNEEVARVTSEVIPDVVMLCMAGSQ